ncbi:hypothetical protein [Haloglycomyces albus]|uniref:hypothetical protein n=1 Tax=Haloglycomyces albus TaxID=526067 RepID=UPI00046CCAD5|nr:hypothetical protein [Haloglycomyces albus]
MSVNEDPPSQGDRNTPTHVKSLVALLLTLVVTGALVVTWYTMGERGFANPFNGSGDIDREFTAEEVFHFEPGETVSLRGKERGETTVGVINFVEKSDHDQCSNAVSDDYREDYLANHGCMYGVEAMFTHGDINGRMCTWLFEFDSDDGAAASREFLRDGMKTNEDDPTWHYGDCSSEKLEGATFINHVGGGGRYMVLTVAALPDNADEDLVTEFERGVEYQHKELRNMVQFKARE